MHFGRIGPILASQKEIDWIEEREGRLYGYEFTFSRTGKMIPKLFLETYPEATVELINEENYLEFAGL